MKELSVGSSAWAVWPGDPKRAPRPVIVIAVQRGDEDVPTLCRAIYGTTKRTSSGRPGDLVVVKDDAQSLGFKYETRFDTMSAERFSEGALDVVGHIDDVLGLREALIAARKSVKV